MGIIVVDRQRIVNDIYRFDWLYRSCNKRGLVGYMDRWAMINLSLVIATVVLITLTAWSIIDIINNIKVVTSMFSNYDNIVKTTMTMSYIIAPLFTSIIAFLLYPVIRDWLLVVKTMDANTLYKMIYVLVYVLLIEIALFYNVYSYGLLKLNGIVVTSSIIINVLAGLSYGVIAIVVTGIMYMAHVYVNKYHNIPHNIWLLMVIVYILMIKLMYLETNTMPRPLLYLSIIFIGFTIAEYIVGKIKQHRLSRGIS